VDSKLKKIFCFALLHFQFTGCNTIDPDVMCKTYLVTYSKLLSVLDLLMYISKIFFLSLDINSSLIIFKVFHSI